MWLSESLSPTHLKGFLHCSIHKQGCWLSLFAVAIAEYQRVIRRVKVCAVCGPQGWEVENWGAVSGGHSPQSPKAELGILWISLALLINLPVPALGPPSGPHLTLITSWRPHLVPHNGGPIWTWVGDIRTSTDTNVVLIFINRAGSSHSGSCSCISYFLSKLWEARSCSSCDFFFFSPWFFRGFGHKGPATFHSTEVPFTFA